MQRLLPWFLLVLIAFAWGVREVLRDDAAAPGTRSADEASAPKASPDDLVLAPPMQEIELEEVTPEEEPTEEPVIKDTEVSDHDETDDDEEWEESKGEVDVLSDKPFDGANSNDSIGRSFGRSRSGRARYRRSGRETWRENRHGRVAYNGETYAPILESPFKESRSHPLSTFSIDVDTASYANVRRHLENGQFPPRNAVRVEELLNWFTYHLPEPEGDAAFSRTVEVADCPWDPRNKIVRVGLKGRAPKNDARRPSNLVFLLDVSGSMEDDNKLPLLQTCLRGLTADLTEDDRVSIVTYASSAAVALPTARGHQTDLIREAIGKLNAGGSTNGEGGIHLAYAIAKEHFIEGGVNRVILATDGDFNVGVSNRDALKKIIKEKAKTGVFLSCLGFGTGNYRDDVMEALADNGNGHYAYIDSLEEGVKVLRKELLANLETIAKDVKIQVEFNPANVRSWRLIGYENRTMAARDFNDDEKDAGEIGAGHSVTALYEIVPTTADRGASVDGLRYAPAKPTPAGEHDGELMALKIRYKRPEATESTRLVTYVPMKSTAFKDASEDFRFACSVALFGMALRDSEHRGHAGFAVALDMAASALADDPNGQRSAFLDLIRKAQTISRTN